MRSVADKKLKPIHVSLWKASTTCSSSSRDAVRRFREMRPSAYITRGFGVSVHRMDCKNYLKSIENTEEAGRWVRVTWANTEADVYSTALFITIRERSGIVMDVATVLNGLKIKKTSLSAKDLGEVTTVSIVIEVKNLDELNLAVARLSSIPGAIEIKRGNG